MELKNVTANNLDIAYVEEGEGPLAVLLHGYPETPATYRFLMPALAEAGYRAVAPYMRGFAPTAVPADNDLHIASLIADVNELHERLGGGSDAVLVGHDWGGGTVWGAGSQAPDRWSRLVVADVPPFQFFGAALQSFEGLERLSHFWFFQIGIAEQIMAADDMAYIEWTWSRLTHDGFDIGHDLREAKAAMRAPANFKTGPELYRQNFNAATFGTPQWLDEHSRIWGALPTQPSLYLHGSEDPSVPMDEAGLAAIEAALPEGSRARLVAGAGHVTFVEKPAEVNRLILDFLREQP